MDFKNLTQFDQKRTAAEAIWFYAVYVVFGSVITLLIGLVVLPFLDVRVTDAVVLNAKLGRSVAIILSSGLALFIVLAKDYHRNIFFLGLIFVSAVLASWAGLFVGMIVPAVLSMFSKESEQSLSTTADSVAPSATPGLFDADVEIDATKEVTRTKTVEEGDGYTIVRNEMRTNSVAKVVTADTPQTSAKQQTKKSQTAKSPIKYRSNIQKRDETKTVSEHRTLAEKPVSLPSTKTVEPPMVTNKLKKIEG